MKRIRVEVFAVVTIAGFITLGTVGAKADEWSKAYTLSGKAELRVDTSDANIHVSTWDQNAIAAKVTTDRCKIGDGGIRIEEHRTGDEVEIDVRFPHGIVTHFGSNWHRVDIDIQMPRQGKVDLHTGDGSIHLAQFKGEMVLRSGDGSQELDQVDGTLRATAGDGHIRAIGRFDELDVKTGDGRVEATATAGSAVAGGWRLETGDGSVTLEVPENLPAELDLHSGDGHIDLDLPVVVSTGRIRAHDLHGKMNGGGNLLTIHTGDGSIHLKKS